MVKMHKNGEKNTKFGVYRNLCCGREIVITEGTTFPDCPNHPKLPAHWKPVHDQALPSRQRASWSKEKEKE